MTTQNSELSDCYRLLYGFPSLAEVRRDREIAQELAANLEAARLAAHQQFAAWEAHAEAEAVRRRARRADCLMTIIAVGAVLFVIYALSGALS